MNRTETFFLTASLVGPLDDEPWLKALYCVFLALETAFGTVCNILVILVLAVTPSLRTVENAFVINLSLADLCIAAVTSPSSIVGVLFGKHWFASRPVLCAIVSTLCSAGCVATNWNTTFIALNRYVLICHYPHYHLIFSRFKTFAICMAIWSLMFLIVLPNHIGWGDTRFSDVYFVCSFATHLLSFTLFYVAVGMFVPMSVTFAAYFAIYRKVQSSRLVRNRLLASARKTTGEVTSQPADLDERSFRKNVVIVKKLFASYILYLVLMMPVGVTTLVGHAVEIPHVWYAMTLTLAHGVSLANCVIYAAALGKFWDGLYGMFGIRRQFRQVSETSNTSTGGRVRSKGVTNPTVTP